MTNKQKLETQEDNVILIMLWTLNKDILSKVKLKQEGRTENVKTQRVNMSHYK